ncbi:ribosomal protein L3 [Chloropicon primus]|uniref:Large ribosomal subunit protein uL3m n=1 Tax=Chloropicon primus TaxID=1764295 RepID=A0A5B8MPC6_9CHLO|nr:ribosomal protein L3 [Chloropicon primus]UPR01493.1 ribosomal protein L3 [Chloropicon primus]|eukprot:QDZ22277.1 ribosomal protein L3 [Chloropicon primus]
MMEGGFIEPRDPKTRKREGFPTAHKRCGAVAMKCGMTREWDANGVGVPLTVLWLDENKVVQVKSVEKEGHYAVQVGASSRRRKRLNKAVVGHYVKHLGKEAEVSRKVVEFKVTENCLLEGGKAINADHFVVGQLVDVQGTTRGKGFAGGMKRHGMKGGPASHGTTKAHRTIGSTGQCQDPGRVFKGKKMPGRMGGKTCTQQKLLVYKVDPVHNLVYVKGQVPGGKGSYVTLVDSKIAFQDVALPYPTRAEEGRQTEVTVAHASMKNNPFERYYK